MHAAGEFVAFVDPLDFRGGLLDSREGPWEVMTPRSSDPGGEPTPLRGTANLRLVNEVNTLTQKKVIRPLVQNGAVRLSLHFVTFGVRLLPRHASRNASSSDTNHEQSIPMFMCGPDRKTNPQGSDGPKPSNKMRCQCLTPRVPKRSNT